MNEILKYIWKYQQEQEEVIAVKRASVMEDLSKVEPAVLEAQQGKTFISFHNVILQAVKYFFFSVQLYIVNNYIYFHFSFFQKYTFNFVVLRHEVLIFRLIVIKCNTSVL